MDIGTGFLAGVLDLDFGVCFRGAAAFLVTPAFDFGVLVGFVVREDFVCVARGFEVARGLAREVVLGVFGAAFVVPFRVAFVGVLER